MNYFSKFLLIFINFIIYNECFNIKILKTSILNFAPQLKLHHLVLLENKSDLYSIDFSPINQTSQKILLKLLFAQNVPAEIRLRKIENISFSEEKEIIDNWSSMIKNNYEESEELSDFVYSGIDDESIKSFIDKINYWDKKMNLYNHNCQHFSKFIQRLYLKNTIL
jgi:hypothetical protein